MNRGDRLVLDSGLEFIVLAKKILDDKTYLFVTDVDENPSYLFVRVDGENKLTAIEDPELHVKLLSMLEPELKGSQKLLEKLIGADK